MFKPRTGGGTDFVVGGLFSFGGGKSQNCETISGAYAPSYVAKITTPGCSTALRLLFFPRCLHHRDILKKPLRNRSPLKISPFLWGENHGRNRSPPKFGGGLISILGGDRFRWAGKIMAEIDPRPNLGGDFLQSLPPNVVQIDEL